MSYALFAVHYQPQAANIIPDPGGVCAPYYRIDPVMAVLHVFREVTPIAPTDAIVHVCREIT